MKRLALGTFAVVGTGKFVSNTTIYQLCHETNRGYIFRQINDVKYGYSGHYPTVDAALASMEDVKYIKIFHALKNVEDSVDSCITPPAKLANNI